MAGFRRDGHICDWICENVYISHIQIFNFKVKDPKRNETSLRVLENIRISYPMHTLQRSLFSQIELCERSIRIFVNFL